jgi:hypothetical protein
LETDEDFEVVVVAVVVVVVVLSGTVVLGMVLITVLGVFEISSVISC